MKKEDCNLKERSKHFALRIIRLFSSLPKTAEAANANPTRAQLSRQKQSMRPSLSTKDR
jgi:hypothetical protein